jgi:hypothetical protein
MAADALPFWRVGGRRPRQVHRRQHTSSKSPLRHYTRKRSHAPVRCQACFRRLQANFRSADFMREHKDEAQPAFLRRLRLGWAGHARGRGMAAGRDYNSHPGSLFPGVLKKNGKTHQPCAASASGIALLKAACPSAGRAGSAPPGGTAPRWRSPSEIAAGARRLGLIPRGPDHPQFRAHDPSPAAMAARALTSPTDTSRQIEAGCSVPAALPQPERHARRFS